MQSSSPRYRPAARRLHWLTAAIVILAVIPAGIWIRYFEPADQAFKLRLYKLHESFGVVVWLLVLGRLAFRWAFPPPAWPPETPALVRVVAGGTHVILYLLLLTMPVVGFLATNAWGFPLRLFEWVPLPSPVGKDEALAKLLSFAHWCGAIAMGLLLLAHIGGGLYHRFIARDALSRRMF